MVYALASLLDPKTDEATRRLWNELEQGCSLTGIQLTPYPHFSWCGAERFKLEQVRKALPELTASIPPFQVITAGLGIFTGAEPILYISLVRNPVLNAVHEKVMTMMRGLMIGENRYYLAENWVPHITLAYRDVSPGKLACAVDSLACHSFSFEIGINNISLMYQIDQTAGIDLSLPLTGVEEGNSK